jgi:tetratricopeptide (TPR) repeat protein
VSSVTADLVRAMVEQGATAQALQLAGESLEATQGLDRARLLLAAASAHTAQGNVEPALAMAVEAGELFDSQGDRAGLCDAIAQAGGALRAAGDHAASIAALHRAEALAHALADPLRQSRVLRNLGIASSLLGRHGDALLQLTRAVALAEAHAGPHEARTVRLSLLNARSRRLHSLPAEERQREGEALIAAWAQLAQALASADQARQSVMAWGNHAITLHLIGRSEAAVPALLALLPRYKSYGMRPNEGLTYAELGRCHEALGDLLHAREHFLEAAHILGEGGVQDDLIDALAGLERCEAALGEAAAAAAVRAQREALAATRTDEQARRALARPGLRRELARLAVHPPAASPASPSET